MTLLFNIVYFAFALFTGLILAWSGVTFASFITGARKRTGKAWFSFAFDVVFILFVVLVWSSDSRLIVWPAVFGIAAGFASVATMQQVARRDTFALTSTWFPRSAIVHDRARRRAVVGSFLALGSMVCAVGTSIAFAFAV
jgi:hypothetical protein